MSVCWVRVVHGRHRVHRAAEPLASTACRAHDSASQGVNVCVMCQTGPMTGHLQADHATGHCSCQVGSCHTTPLGMSLACTPCRLAASTLKITAAGKEGTGWPWSMLLELPRTREHQWLPHTKRREVWWRTSGTGASSSMGMMRCRMMEARQPTAKPLDSSRMQESLQQHGLLSATPSLLL